MWLAEWFCFAFSCVFGYAMRLRHQRFFVDVVDVDFFYFKFKNWNCLLLENDEFYGFDSSSIGSLVLVLFMFAILHQKIWAVFVYTLKLLLHNTWFHFS